MSEQLEPLDLVVDLNTMDETGLPWAFLKRAADSQRSVIDPRLSARIDAALRRRELLRAPPASGPARRPLPLLASESWWFTSSGANINRSR